MQFVLMRHATRASSFENDGPLSSVGHSQASGAALRLMPKGILPRASRLYCSPKLRARQTLSPLSQHTGVPLTIDARLDERSSNEPYPAFDARIRTFIESAVAEALIQPGTQSVLACTHMDWLEAVLPLLDSNLADHEISAPWSAGEFRIFEVSPDRIWTLSGHGILESL